jgi:hypothetical protein
MTIVRKLSRNYRKVYKERIELILTNAVDLELKYMAMPTYKTRETLLVGERMSHVYRGNNKGDYREP